jgi:putative transposase
MSCFLDDLDYGLYLGLVEEFAGLNGCAVHAYVLMPNHVHLLLTPERDESATNLMRAIGQRYVQHFNRKYRRTGSLWEGRFHSSLVDAESYFFTCQRYVELNPVRRAPHRTSSSPTDCTWRWAAANSSAKAHTARSSITSFPSHN